MQLDKIGRYELLERLGRGTSADVYLAKDTVMGRQVALKVIALETSDLQPFNEARVLARLVHPNIVIVHGSDVIDSKIVVDMEYIPGVSLCQMLQKGKPVSITRALKITAQLVNALAYAHKAGVIHRDIKPANILLGRDDLVKVVDFGIADVLGTQGYLAGAGTYSHMAPECFLDKSDRRSDLYSVGIILYEMLTGQLPVQAERNTVTAWRAQLDKREAVKPLANSLSKIPNGLQEIISLTLAYDKQKRFQSAEDLLDALKRNNLYLLPNSEEELRQIDRFEAPYNRIDKHLRQELGVERKVGFANVVRLYARQHPNWKSEQDLLRLAKLRNELSHELMEADQYRRVPTIADTDRITEIAEQFNIGKGQASVVPLNIGKGQASVVPLPPITIFPLPPITIFPSAMTKAVAKDRTKSAKLPSDVPPASASKSQTASREDQLSTVKVVAESLLKALETSQKVGGKLAKDLEARLQVHQVKPPQQVAPDQVDKRKALSLPAADRIFESIRDKDVLFIYDNEGYAHFDERLSNGTELKRHLYDPEMRLKRLQMIQKEKKILDRTKALPKFVQATRKYFQGQVAGRAPLTDVDTEYISQILKEGDIRREKQQISRDKWQKFVTRLLLEHLTEGYGLLLFLVIMLSLGAYVGAVIVHHIVKATYNYNLSILWHEAIKTPYDLGTMNWMPIGMLGGSLLGVVIFGAIEFTLWLKEEKRIGY